MRLVITQNVTVDGAVEMLTDWFDPSDQDEELLAEMRRLDEACDAMLLGRRTFEDFRGYWPQQTDDSTGITDQLNRVTKYVVSSTMTDPQWQNSVVLAGDPVQEVRRLKALDGADIVLTGSITLAHLMIAEGLVDEFRMFVHPAVQGSGRRFFPEDHPVDLTLVDGRAYPSGVTYTAYRPAR